MTSLSTIFLFLVSFGFFIAYLVTGSEHGIDRDERRSDIHAEVETLTEWCMELAKAIDDQWMSDGGRCQFCDLYQAYLAKHNEAHEDWCPVLLARKILEESE